MVLIAAHAGYAQVADRFEAMEPTWLGAAIAGQFAAFVGYALAYRRIVTVLGGPRMGAGLLVRQYVVIAPAACIAAALARHSHRRSELYRTGGFTYLKQVDAWECPEGEHLHRIETDLHQRLALYRARAEACNACPRKGACTIPIRDAR